MAQMRALEDEVGALSAEVTRLRLMVQQCTEREQKYVALASENEQLKIALQEARMNGVAQKSSPPHFSAHRGADHGRGSAPVVLDALPAMFSGADGTARLFKAIMDAYPWLVPPDVQEAQVIVRQERELQAEERRQRHSRRAQRQQLELAAEREESLQDRNAMVASVSHAQHQRQYQAERGLNGAVAGNAELPNVPPIPIADAAPTVAGYERSLPPKVSPRQSSTPLASVPTSAFDRVGTPVTSEGWGVDVAGDRRPSSVGSQSQSSSPVQGITAPVAVGGTKAQTMAGTGVVLGSRPGAKKPIPSLVKKWKQGAGSDSDEDHPYDGALRSLTPPVKDTTKTPADNPEDDHDF